MNFSFDFLKRGTWAWIETILLTIVIYLICRYFNPSDPFFTTGPFPWIWLTAFIVALRYGTGPGVVSGFIIIAIYIYTNSWQAIQIDYNRIYIASGLIMTLIFAEFRNIWYERIKRADLVSDYAQRQLDTLSKTYFFLRHSHDILEESLIYSPTTLRSAIEDLRKILIKSRGDFNLESTQKLLDLICYYCSIDKCAIYLFHENVLDKKPFVNAEFNEHLVGDDELVQRALEEDKTCYHAVNELSKNNHSKYLVVAPIITSNQKHIGLFVVKAMPFLKMQDENLSILTVILSYYANLQESVEDSKQLLKAYPDCDTFFASEFYHMLKLKKEANIDTFLSVLYVYPNQYQDEIVEKLEKQHRALDFVWIKKQSNFSAIFVLMPFSGRNAALGYKNRIIRWMENNYKKTYSEGHLRIRSRKIIAKSNPIQLVSELLEEGK
ncbi:MAG: PelD GGDEF domain-containing protein [Pseudomonadota bacterium]